MSPLTRLGAGRYRDERLGVEVERTAVSEMPWQLSGPDPDGSGVAYARTLKDARAFLREIEQRTAEQPAATATPPDRLVLLSLHRYLFPERYEPVETYQWHAGTIQELAGLLEQALAGNPDARISQSPA